MLRIPYGNTYLTLDAPGAAVLTSRVGEWKVPADGEAVVRAAMVAPIGSPLLEELAKGKRTAVILLSDHTRPVPSRDILPPMLAALRAGNPGIQVTFLIATGFHRPTGKEELLAKLGPELMEQAEIRVHDSRDASAQAFLGTLPSGAPCLVNKTALETDLLLAEGFIEPHFFAGFSGGRKSVLPGVCDQRTVLGNHRGAFIHDPLARTGVLEHNPIHEDMVAAARMAKLAYIVNVVIDEEKRTVAAFAGDPIAAHRAGCDFLAGYCRVPAVPADIVVTGNGGAPLDQNIYQCVKSMTAAEACCRPDGVIIECAACADGHGGEGFFRALADCGTPAQLYETCRRTPWDQTLPDQWESQILARILMKHQIIFVTRPELKETVEAMKMTYAPGVAEALALARSWGKTDLAVIPNGISVIVEPQTRP